MSITFKRQTGFLQVPAAASLTVGELAVGTGVGNLFTKLSSGVVTQILSTDFGTKKLTTDGINAAQIQLTIPRANPIAFELYAMVSLTEDTAKSFRVEVSCEGGAVSVVSVGASSTTAKQYVNAPTGSIQFNPTAQPALNVPYLVRARGIIVPSTTVGNALLNCTFDFEAGTTNPRGFKVHAGSFVRFDYIN